MPNPSTLLFLPLALVACSPRATSTSITADPWREVTMGAERWGALDCDPVGESRTVTGRVERANPAEFKKPFQGDWLVMENGERWVLSYGPISDLDPFLGTAIVLRGHACTKRGQAVLGQHFHVDGIRSAGKK